MNSESGYCKLIVWRGQAGSGVLSNQERYTSPEQLGELRAGHSTCICSRGFPDAWPLTKAKKDHALFHSGESVTSRSVLSTTQRASP